MNFLLTFLVLLQFVNCNCQKQLISDKVEAFTPADTLCLKKFDFLVDSYGRQELWAIKWFNSWAKVPAGLFSGHFESVGSFQQCIRSRQSSQQIGNVQGQHCMIHFRPRSEFSDDESQFEFTNQLNWREL